jgi:hypothetical protein
MRRLLFRIFNPVTMGSRADLLPCGKSPYFEDLNVERNTISGCYLKRSSGAPLGMLRHRLLQTYAIT